MKNSPQTFRTRAIGVLASILAAGAVAPQIQPGTPSQAAQRNAPTTLTRAAPGSERQALPPPSAPTGARALALIGGIGPEPYSMFSRAGMDRKTFGMSSWCKKMRLKNVRNGVVPHYRPRAKS